VIVYESFSSIKHVYVDSKAQFQNRYGSFSHKVSATLTPTPAGTFFEHCSLLLRRLIPVMDKLHPTVASLLHRHHSAHLPDKV